MTESPETPSLEATLAQLTDQTLGRGERAGHLALTLSAGTMGLLLVLLLATEPAIPLRTSVAIGLMVVIAASWVAFGLRVLSRRRPLLAQREVVAARMAVLFSALFTAGTVVVGLVNAGIVVTPATWLALTLLAVAVANLARAHWRRRKLQSLRKQLERQLEQLRGASGLSR